MSGDSIAAALGSAKNLIRGLQATDRVAVVVFNQHVQVVQALAQLADRESLIQRLDGIRAEGNTALFAGWEEGAKQLAPFTSPQRTSRVILLTDGQANQGLTDENAIAAKVRELAKAGVTTSTVGLGQGFNETLLAKISDAGEGQAHFGQRPEDLEEGFAEEFLILSTAHLRQIELRVSGGNGVVAKLLRRDGTREATTRLGTLAFGTSLDAIVELDIGSERQASGLISVTATGKDASGAVITLGPVVLSLPELDAAAWAALTPDAAVAGAVAESDFADEFLRIHALASEGSVPAALAALRELRQRPGATDWAKRSAKYIVGLADDDLAGAIKELSYSSRAFRTRSKNINVAEAYSSTHDYLLDANLPAHLSKKVGMGRNRKRALEENEGETK
jgi:Ca-activated chloride channel family protein